MGRPRAESIDVATPQRILEAAATVFALHGYQRATLADIAAMASIRRPSLLYHFDSKEKLYAAVVSRTFGQLGQALAPSMVSEGPFEAQLEGMLRAYTDFVTSHPLESRIVVREILEEDGPGAEILREQVVPLLAAVVSFVQTAGQGKLREGLPVQAAILQVVMDGLMQASVGALRELLWGPLSADRNWRLCRTLFLKDELQGG